MKPSSRNPRVRVNKARLTELLCEIEVDEDGCGVPNQEVLDRIEQEHPDAPPAEKYWLAQAQMLVDAFEQAKESK